MAHDDPSAAPLAATPSHRPVRRRFIEVDGRRVHYLRVGEGPPAVLVHSSPTSAWYVLPQMRLLAERCTCFAFDTPGFGLSEALPGDALTVADLARALAANMVALGLPPCPVYGTHTGAAIALSLAAHHAGRVTALVLDGLPVFTPAEQAQIFEGYFEPLKPDAGGGHYARTWTRFRDQYIWFPWTQKHPERHNETDLGTTAAVHDWTMNFFHAGRSYMPAYRAACFYGEQALADARAVPCPVLYTAIESDMLYPHLDRLPPLRAEQTVRRVGNDKSRRDALIAEGFARWPAGAPAPRDAAALNGGPGVQMQFIDLPDDGARPRGQVLLRHAGAVTQPPLLLLHDAPGAGLRLAVAGGLIEQLAAQHRVLAPDLPGCGGSAPLHDDAAPLAAWADVAAAVCEVAGVSQVCVYGIGIGASVALALTQRHPTLVQSLVLRGVALPDAQQRAALRARYAPPIELQPDGCHWYRTWLMLRDQQVYFPWFDTRAAALRRVPADFGADALHDWTFELMQQHASYHRLIEAAFDFDAAASLQAVRLPLAICTDPQQPFHVFDAKLRALRPDAVGLPVPSGADDGGHAAAIAAFIADRAP